MARIIDVSGRSCSRRASRRGPAWKQAQSRSPSISADSSPAMASYRITTGDGRSTEELVAAGEYAYAHSCVTSDNFPARPCGPGEREIVLLEVDRALTSEA